MSKTLLKFLPQIYEILLALRKPTDLGEVLAIIFMVDLDVPLSNYIQENKLMPYSWFCYHYD